MVIRKQKWCGQSTWLLEDGKVSEITIYLDPRRDGRVRLVIHELLHIYMGLHLHIQDRMVYELEEEAILAWEKILYAWLHDAKRAKQLDSWDRAIERKMQ